MKKIDLNNRNNLNLKILFKNFYQNQMKNFKKQI